MQQTSPGVSLRRALLGPFTTLSLGAAAIHFSVIQTFYQSWWAFGAFFAVIGWFQALWPMAYVLRPTVRLAQLGALANLAIAVIWAWSRLYGLPFGPGGGIPPQPIGLPDVAATTFEVLLVAGLVLTSIGPIRRETIAQRIAGPTSVAWSTVIAIAVAVSTSAVITVGMGPAH